MRNLWIQRETPIVTWRADLSVLLHRPDDLAQLMAQILDAGEGFATHLIGAERIDAIKRRWPEEHVVQCAFGAKETPAARLSWYDGSDHVVEGVVSDLGMLLRQLEPVEDAIPSICKVAGSAPLEISGTSLRYDAESLVPDRGAPVTVSFLSHSDIWFPFVPGEAHPLVFGMNEIRMFDNRELAMRHTPRLNGFLADVSAAVVAAGGTWMLVESETDQALMPWIARDSIRLDGLVPDLMPEEALQAPWRGPDDE